LSQLQTVGKVSWGHGSGSAGKLLATFFKGATKFMEG
jgi:hypothetical protein